MSTVLNNPQFIIKKNVNKLPLLMNNKLEELTEEDFAVGDDLVKIRDYACYGLTNLKKVTIPPQVKSIGQYAFYGCGGLEELIFAENGILDTLGSYSFHGAFQGELANLILPKLVNNIPTYSFYACKLNRVVLGGNGQLTITKDAFRGASINNFIIREGTTSVNKSSGNPFYNVNFFRFVLPSSIQEIIEPSTSAYVIQNLVVSAKTPPIISNSIGTLNNATRVFIPITSKNQYETATNWGTLVDKYYPLVNTYEDLANVTNYEYVCVKGNEEYKIYQFIDGQWYEVE